MESAERSEQRQQAGDLKRSRHPWRVVVKWEMILVVWLPIVLVTGLHYYIDSDHHWVHDLLRRINLEP